jgi:hypothetical protein
VLRWVLGAVGRAQVQAAQLGTHLPLTVTILPWFPCPLNRAQCLRATCALRSLCRGTDLMMQLGAALQPVLGAATSRGAGDVASGARVDLPTALILQDLAGTVGQEVRAVHGWLLCHFAYELPSDCMGQLCHDTPTPVNSFPSFPPCSWACWQMCSS